jgi:hypothetical protein
MLIPALRGFDFGPILGQAIGAAASGGGSDDHHSRCEGSARSPVSHFMAPKQFTVLFKALQNYNTCSIIVLLGIVYAGKSVAEQFASLGPQDRLRG